MEKQETTREDQIPVLTHKTRTTQMSAPQIPILTHETRTTRLSAPQIPVLTHETRITQLSAPQIPIHRRLRSEDVSVSIVILTPLNLGVISYVLTTNQMMFGALDASTGDPCKHSL